MGYTLIRGALHNIGHELGRSTIQAILSDAGIAPAPERTRRGSWAAFLKAQWGAVAATDFFSVEVLTWASIVRYHVFFDRSEDSCGRDRWHQARPASGLGRANGSRAARCGRWVSEGRAILIHDRDPLFGVAFTRLLKAGGVRGVRLPSRSPNLNAYAERFVGRFGVSVRVA